MAQDKELLALLTRIRKSLDNNNIASTFNMLVGYLTDKKEFGLLEMTKRLHSSYQFMLEYALTGNSDPDRNKLIADIKADLNGILSELTSNIQMIDDPSIFFSNRRLDRMQNVPLLKILDGASGCSASMNLALEAATYPDNVAQQLEDYQDRLFEKVMALPYAAVRDLKDIKNFCLSPDEDQTLKLILTSALFICLTQQYDRYKLLTLIDIYDNTDDDKLAARLLVSLVIILNQYHSEVSKDPKIAERLNHWKDSLLDYTRLRDVIMAMLKTIDTNRINDKLKNELMPGLQKIQPDVMKRFSNRYGNMDFEDLEENPEWEKVMKESGLEKKLQEFSELQTEGADVMMVPFSQLKNFPFFNKLSHWFLPFSVNHSQLRVLRELDSDVFESMLMIAPFCDSDKYSFALSLNQMPKGNLDMVKMQLLSGIEQIKLQNDERLLKLQNPDFESELVNYLRNLFRFFNLYRNKDQFLNPLASPIKFISLPFIGDTLRETEMINLAAEFYFKRGYYDHSLELFNILAESKPDEHLWDKIGYCQQSLGRPEEALESYRKAEMFSSDNDWRIKMMAFCLKATGQFDEAAEYYSKALEKNPDNLRTIYNCALACMCSGDYNRTIELCYKYEYIKSGVVKVTQLLALALMSNGDKQKGNAVAERLIIEHGFEADDNNYFMMGTLHLMGGNTKEALKFYSFIDKDPEKWEARVKKEMQDLGLLEKNRAILSFLREYATLTI